MTEKAFRYEKLPKVAKGLGGTYRAGEWYFDTDEEADPQWALEAALAWIAWYEFLVNGGLDSE